MKSNVRSEAKAMLGTAELENQESCLLIDLDGSNPFLKSAFSGKTHSVAWGETYSV